MLGLVCLLSGSATPAVSDGTGDRPRTPPFSRTTGSVWTTRTSQRRCRDVPSKVLIFERLPGQRRGEPRALLTSRVARSRLSLKTLRQWRARRGRLRDRPSSPETSSTAGQVWDVTRVAKNQFRTQASYTLQLEVPDSLRESLKEKDIVEARCPEGDHATDSMTRSRKMRKSRGRMPLSARAELHAVRHADLELRCAQRGSGPLTLMSIEHRLARATKTACRRKTTRRPQASMSNPTPLSPLVTVRAGT